MRKEEVEPTTKLQRSKQRDAHEDRHVDQGDEIESLERRLDVCGQLIFNKGVKITQWGKNGLFNNGAGKTLRRKPRGKSARP